MSEYFPEPRHPWASFRATGFQYREGRCPHSVYLSGAHRTAIIPVVAHLDNGSPGYVAAVMCVECGRRFRQTWFVPSDIPGRAAWFDDTPPPSDGAGGPTNQEDAP